MSTITSQTSSSIIWKKIRSIQHKRIHRSIVLKVEGKTVSQPAEVANIFANEYSRRSNGLSTDQAFNKHKEKEEKNSITFPIIEPRKSYNRQFTIQELIFYLQNSSSKSPGPDNIPTQFLKAITSKKLHKLLDFYNYLWESGFPHQWRTAIVVPILKMGKPAAETGSYRPIALTSCVCKVMERMANARLRHYLESENLIAGHQSGFRTGHSTMDALARLESDVRKTFIQDEYCISVFLDISQAFDTVWHHGLLQKLKDMKLEGQLHTGMENWNQDHPERYSNFRGLYIKFQDHGKWPWTR